MQNNNTAGLQISGTATQLEQAVSHLRLAPSAESDLRCQCCGVPLTEGDQVTLYLYTPAGRTGYTISQCHCRTHDEDLTSIFTRGVRELIVNGRIGQCRDHATQQTWPVLLAPSIPLISDADTTTGRAPTDSNTTDTPPWKHGEQLRDRAVDEQTKTNAPPSTKTDIKIGGVQ